MTRTRAQLELELVRLRGMLREREQELGVAAPSYVRGRGGLGKLQARVIATRCAVKGVERQLAELPDTRELAGV